MVRVTFKASACGRPDFEDNVNGSHTVAEVKSLIGPRLGLEPSRIRLVCGGRVWKDEHTIESYDVSDGSIVHCIHNPQAPVPAQASVGAATPSGGNMPFGSPNAMMQDPEAMRQILDSPMMQQMLSNPEILRSMIQMNPQLRDLMERNPEIARIMDDPEVLQQSLRAMRNPAMMREMMRQADRSMSNLETVPGGMDALRRMHNEIADPMYDALTGSDQQQNSGPTPTYNQNTDGAPNSEALPNPWSSGAQAQQTTPPSGLPSGGFGGDSTLGGNRGSAQNQFGGANPFLGGGMDPNMMRMLFGGGGQGGSNAMGPAAFPGGGVGNQTQEEGDTMVTVRYGTGFFMTCSVNTFTHTTVLDFKQKVAQRTMGVAVPNMRLVCKGKVWQDDRTLGSYSVTNGDVVWMMRNVRGPGNPSGPIPAGLHGMLNPFAFNAMQSPQPGIFPQMQPGFGGINVPPADTRAPEERYQSQIQQLTDMGFERQAVIDALVRTNGNLNRAMDILLG